MVLVLYSKILQFRGISRPFYPFAKSLIDPFRYPGFPSLLPLLQPFWSFLDCLLPWPLIGTCESISYTISPVANMQPPLPTLAVLLLKFRAFGKRRENLCGRLAWFLDQMEGGRVHLPNILETRSLDNSTIIRTYGRPLYNKAIQWCKSSTILFDGFWDWELYKYTSGFTTQG